MTERKRKILITCLFFFMIGMMPVALWLSSSYDHTMPAVISVGEVTRMQVFSCFLGVCLGMISMLYLKEMVFKEKE